MFWFGAEAVPSMITAVLRRCARSQHSLYFSSLLQFFTSVLYFTVFCYDVTFTISLYFLLYRARSWQVDRPVPGRCVFRQVEVWCTVPSPAAVGSICRSGTLSYSPFLRPCVWNLLAVPAGQLWKNCFVTNFFKP